MSDIIKPEDEIELTEEEKDITNKLREYLQQFYETQKKKKEQNFKNLPDTKEKK